MIKPKIVVTGAAGFIGTNLIKTLEKDYEVLAIDRRDLKYAGHSIMYARVDLLDLTRLTEVLIEFQPQYVVHLAARTDLKGQKISDYEDNTVAVDNLLTAILATNSVRQIIVSSSMLVCSVGNVPSDVRTYSPSTVYGQSKVIGEQIVLDRLNFLPRTCIVRPTSIWGPFFEAPYKHFFSHVLNKRFFYFGSLCQKKTYGYVENAVSQIIGIIRNDTWNTGDVFYLGDSSSMSIDTFANLIVEESGLPQPITLPVYIIKFLSLVGDFLALFGISFPLTSFRLKNISTQNVIQDNLATQFNMSSEISNAEGVHRTLDWLSKNEEG